MVIIDHYEIDFGYEKELKKQTGVKIFVLDDTYEKHYCDILLNHNIYGDESRYHGLVPPHCILRCGADYTLLRDEFIKENQKPKKSPSENQQRNVLIAMGGTDPSNITIDILTLLSTFAHIHAHVVTTTANPHLTELIAYAEKNTDVTLHINTNQMAVLMHKADFAIVTPSVTLNEIFYMKVPFIAIKTAENQKEMYQYLLKNNYRVLEKFDTVHLKTLLEKLIDTEKITLLNFTDLSLSDKKMILKWRNDPDIRQWMFSQEPIVLQDHLNYIDSLKQREDRLYFLVKKGAQPIGVIDFTDIDQQNKSTEFGIYANPDLKKVGTLLMDEMLRFAFKTLRIDTLVAKVFKNNTRAINLYMKYNFEAIDNKEVDTDHIIHLELKR